VIKLDLNSTDDNVVTQIRSQLTNVYSRFSGSDNYQRNRANLGLIMFCVITVSAVATGATNAYSHVGRVGWFWAGLIALLISAFVEKFYLTLRQGLTEVYEKGRQRAFATWWYRLLQTMMVLNVTLLGIWIVGIEPPAWLLSYNHYSIGLHFAAALLGVSSVLDSDPVIENRRLEMKAQAALQDLITIRKAALYGNPVVMLAVRFKVMKDAFKLARQILSDSPDLPLELREGFKDLSGHDTLVLGNDQLEGGNLVSLGKHQRR
jgi:hypothetical protein